MHVRRWALVQNLIRNIPLSPTSNFQFHDRLRVLLVYGVLLLEPLDTRYMHTPIGMGARLEGS